MSTLDLLPNCLTRDAKVDWSISRPGWEWQYLFCGSCGADGGKVLKTYLPREFAYYICEDCLAKHGHVLGTYVEPDEVFRQKVVQAMHEQYGRVLTEAEILYELGDPSSTISKLEKEGKGK
jgi:hypothetical protein